MSSMDNISIDIISDSDLRKALLPEQDRVQDSDTRRTRLRPGRPASAEVEPKAAGTSGVDNDAIPSVIVCKVLLSQLSRDAVTPAHIRQAWMEDALIGLLGEQSLNDLVLGELAQALHDADQDSYEAWTNNQFKRGMVLAITTQGYYGKLLSNIISLFRPQLIRELKINSGVEMVMLDTALGSLYEYAQAVSEVRRRGDSEGGRTPKLAAAHARIVAAAQPLLKTFLSTLDTLRKKDPRRSLNIRAAGDVAIQVNEAVVPGKARSRDGDILVGEMKLPGLPVVQDAEAQLEAAVV